MKQTTKVTRLVQTADCSLIKTLALFNDQTYKNKGQLLLKTAHPLQTYADTHTCLTQQN